RRGAAPADPGVETELRVSGTAAGQAAGGLTGGPHAAGAGAVGFVARNRPASAIEIGRGARGGVALRVPDLSDGSARRRSQILGKRRWKAWRGRSAVIDQAGRAARSL